MLVRSRDEGGHGREGTVVDRESEANSMRCEPKGESYGDGLGKLKARQNSLPHRGVAVHPQGKFAGFGPLTRASRARGEVLEAIEFEEAALKIRPGDSFFREQLEKFTKTTEAGKRKSYGFIVAR